MPPALLLTLTFALGCGAAMTLPTYQAVIPELVPRAQLPAASGLGAISMNAARAIGPAIAGVLVAQISVAAVFAINAATFALFAIVLLVWRRPVDTDPPSPEPFVAALRAGGRYVRHSPVMRRMLLRLALFVLPGVALWALLPLVANRRLHMGPGGYGLLLAALGAGAIVGAPLMPRLRAWMGDNQLLLSASVVYAAVLAVLALVRTPWVVAVALVPAGTAWMMVLSNLGAMVQMFLPGWVRARGLGTYQIVFFGGQGIGAFVWGVVADRIGLVPAFVAAAVLTALGAATVPVRPLLQSQHLNRDPATYWPEPILAVEPEPSDGPVVVEVRYTVPPEREEAFLTAMRTGVRRSRMRTGAVQWGIFRDGERPQQLVEIYVVPTWDEHMRQHTGRLTGADQEVETRARALAAGPPEVTHLLTARPLP
jgi:predicted MFS family arabinose efflux permease/quinol monooxygenase YgiN